MGRRRVCPRREGLYNPTIEILILCTANQCRSPMAEALLLARLDDHGRPDVVVRSAGFLAPGAPAADAAIDVMASRGIDLRPHLSRQVTPDDLIRADLVVCMARRHLRESVTLVPPAFARTFTLKDLARRVGELGGCRPGESLDDWLPRANTDRAPSQYLGDSPADDVADPVGQSRRVFKRTAAELDDLLGRVETELL